MNPPGGCHFLTKTWPHPTAYRNQCWDASGQTTNRSGTQSHPSADRLPKIFLSTQLPAKHIPWHGPAHQRDKTQLNQPMGRDQSLPPGSLHKPCKLASSTRRQQQKQEELQSCSLWNGNHTHSKLDKNETAEEYVPDEGTRYNPRTTKLSGNRKSTQKRIQSNDSKVDPRSRKKNGGTGGEDKRNV